MGCEVLLSIIITSFKEPNVDFAIKAIVEQEIPEDYELIVAAPDAETKAVVEKFAEKYPRVRYFQDPGKGKSFALNLLFKEAKGRILIFTDGDVYFGKNAIAELIKPFADETVGIATGRVVSINNRDSQLGYWSHLLCDAGAHSIRQELSNQGKFLECSAYILALRAGLIGEVPLHVAEDAIMPYYIWKKGMKIVYVPEAVVNVKWPNNFNDWVKQKVRTAKAHETLMQHAPDFPRVKSFRNEALMGWHRALSYPKTPKEFAWTLGLFAARLYVWTKVLADTKIKNKNYTDNWEKVESTK